MKDIVRRDKITDSNGGWVELEIWDYRDKGFSFSINGHSNCEFYRTEELAAESAPHYLAFIREIAALRAKRG